MPTSNAQKKATLKYQKEKQDDVHFRVPKGKKKLILDAVREKGYGFPTFVIELLEKELNITIKEKKTNSKE